MTSVNFTTHLQRFFLTLKQGTVADVIRSLERQYPDLAATIVDERGTLRKHVNIL